MAFIRGRLGTPPVVPDRSALVLFVPVPVDRWPYWKFHDTKDILARTYLTKMARRTRHPIAKLASTVFDQLGQRRGIVGRVDLLRKLDRNM